MSKLDKDVYNIARSILAGYERRKAEYLTTLEELRNPMKAMRYDNAVVSSTADLSQPESMTDRILEYEKSFNARAVGAVEQAKECLRVKYGNNAYVENIFKAVCLNCQNRQEYPFRKLNMANELYMHLNTFCDLKDEIIDIIADLMELK